MNKYSQKIYFVFFSIDLKKNCSNTRNYSLTLNIVNSGKFLIIIKF